VQFLYIASSPLPYSIDDWFFLNPTLQSTSFPQSTLKCRLLTASLFRIFLFYLFYLATKRQTTDRPTGRTHLISFSSPSGKRLEHKSKNKQQEASFLFLSYHEENKKILLNKQILYVCINDCVLRNLEKQNPKRWFKKSKTVSFVPLCCITWLLCFGYCYCSVVLQFCESFIFQLSVFSHFQYLQLLVDIQTGLEKLLGENILCCPLCMASKYLTTEQNTIDFQQIKWSTELFIFSKIQPWLLCPQSIWNEIE